MPVVALDATPLSVPLSGIGRYTLELARHLARARPEARVELLSGQPFEVPEGPGNLLSDPRPARAWERHWWSAGLPLRLRQMSATLFHGTDFAIPFWGSVPAVLTIHDLTPLRFPELCFAAAARRIARRLPRMVARARAIIVPSERIKEEAMEALKLPATKVFVTPLGVPPKFGVRSAECGIKKGHTGPDSALRIPHSAFVLFVGTIEPRKNLVRLINAFARIARRLDAKLMLVGRRAWGWNEVIRRIAALGLESKVIVRGHVSDEELGALYRQAAVLVYPSLYEGFGLPVLEAMACGTPVVTSRSTAAADVAGGAAWLVDPQSEEEIAAAIQAVIENPSLAATLSRRGFERASQFSWERTAELTWHVYDLVSSSGFRVASSG